MTCTSFNFVFNVLLIFINISLIALSKYARCDRLILLAVCHSMAR